MMNIDDDELNNSIYEMFYMKFIKMKISTLSLSLTSKSLNTHNTLYLKVPRVNE